MGLLDKVDSILVVLLDLNQLLQNPTKSSFFRYHVCMFKALVTCICMDAEGFWVVRR